MSENRWLSRKFIIAFLFALTGCGVFAFTAKLNGSEFITLVGIIMGVFTTGDAALNFIHRAKADPDNPSKP